MSLSRVEAHLTAVHRQGQSIDLIEVERRLSCCRSCRFLSGEACGKFTQGLWLVMLTDGSPAETLCEVWKP